MRIAVLFALTTLFLNGQQTMRLTIEGLKRTALVYAPAKTAGAPLVFAFHGSGDTAENFSGTGFHEAWKDAVVIYPQAAPPRAMQTELGRNNDRDLKFFDALLSEVRAQYKIDESRIFATGFSNGAKFVYLLWSERPQIFAAFAPVAGQHADSLRIREPKPVMHIAGTEDHQNEYMLQLATIEMARKVNGATGSGTRCGPQCIRYESSTPVITILHGGGHVWPDETTEQIVNFFNTVKR